MSFYLKAATSILWVFIVFLVSRSIVTAQIVPYSVSQPNIQEAPTKILVRYNQNNPGPSMLQATAQEIGGGAHFAGSLSGSSPIRVFEVSDVEDALEAARNDPNVLGAMRDPVVTSFMNTNDQFLPNQWNLRNLGVAGSGNTAWDLIPTPINTTTGTVKVAIIDTGVDKTHPDLAGKFDSDPKNWVNCYLDPAAPTPIPGAPVSCTLNSGNDVDGHGTHVAGIVAAATDNTIGVAGTGFGVKLMSVRVLNNNGVGTLTDVIRGMKWAADNGAKVINLSLGSYEYDMQPEDGIDPKALLQADGVDYAWNKGVVILAAAGNCGSGGNGCKRYGSDGTTVVHEIVNEKSYPAVLNNVISVGALNTTNQITAYSERGSDKVDVAAPGGTGNGNTSILSLFPADLVTPTPGVTAYYAYASGTSMATPHVSGVAALLWSTKTGITKTEVVDAILNKANTTLSGMGSNWQFGVVDACKSVYSVRNNGAVPPVGSSVCAAAPSPTIVPDVLVATPTPFPQTNICAQPCTDFVTNYTGSKRKKGDANCSGDITKKDFNVIKQQYGSVPSKDKKNNGNVQCIVKNGGSPATYTVNLGDFEAWRRNAKNLGQLGATDTDEEGN